MKNRTKRGQVIMWNKLLKATGVKFRITKKDLPGLDKAVQSANN
mgnify:CR=1 FL=1